MGQDAGVMMCPKGHASTEADYCSECGAKIQGRDGSDALQHSRASAGTGDVCPDCGTLREQGGVVFCEVCGYNFATGAHGEVPLPAQPEPEPVEAAETAPQPQPSHKGAKQWAAIVSVDPTLRSAESPEAPSDLAPFSISIEQPVSLVGRRNEARAIFPEISLDHDEAVSRCHALLQLDPDGGLQLRDIGAANGTRLNGKDCTPMTDYPLVDGDEITLGHWTRIKVQAN